MQNTYIIYKFLTMKILKISTITVAVLVAVFIIIACIFPPIAKNYINKHSKELIGRQINIKGLYINIYHRFPIIRSQRSGYFRFFRYPQCGYVSTSSVSE